MNLRFSKNDIRSSLLLSRAFHFRKLNSAPMLGPVLADDHGSIRMYEVLTRTKVYRGCQLGPTSGFFKGS